VTDCSKTNPTGQATRLCVVADLGDPLTRWAMGTPTAHDRCRGRTEEYHG